MPQEPAALHATGHKTPFFTYEERALLFRSCHAIPRARRSNGTCSHAYCRSSTCSIRREMEPCKRTVRSLGRGGWRQVKVPFSSYVTLVRSAKQVQDKLRTALKQPLRSRFRFWHIAGLHAVTDRKPGKLWVRNMPRTTCSRYLADTTRFRSARCY